MTKELYKLNKQKKKTIGIVLRAFQVNVVRASLWALLMPTGHD